jgi:hypothetical protein
MKYFTMSLNVQLHPVLYTTYTRLDREVGLLARRCIYTALVATTTPRCNFLHTIDVLYEMVHATCHIDDLITSVNSSTGHSHFTFSLSLNKVQYVCIPTDQPGHILYQGTCMPTYATT